MMEGVAVEGKELVERVLQHRKRTLEFYLWNLGSRVPEDAQAQRARLGVKIGGEYSAVRHMPPVKQPPTAAKATGRAERSQMLPPPPKAARLAAATDVSSSTTVKGVHPHPTEPGITVEDVYEEEEDVTEVAAESQFKKILDTIPANKRDERATTTSTAMVAYQGATSGADTRFKAPTSTALARSRHIQLEKPEWHAPWKLMRTISGHLGWVRSVAVEPGNEWFVTGSADRTIKVWDLASGMLKITLTGHINTPRGLAISPRHPYLFSAGEDKMIKCWDLEYNKVIRQYHGHLSGIYCLALHPTIDVLVTGGRDSTARVWDIRTKAEVHCLAGHNHTVGSLATQAVDPQILTGSMDCTVKMWDLAAGKCAVTLTHHKKGVRALQMHPSEYTFASGSADNIKKWKLPDGDFLHNLSGHNTILHTMALNSDNVLVTGGDDGSLYFWDWKTGYNFQRLQTMVQPGSLDCEAAIYASTFDQTGTRLITTEADKTIKIWKEDETATPETHPVDWRPSIAEKRW
ncbi:Pleiotropic regulator 1 [Balamuthia mandrillaris]